MHRRNIYLTHPQVTIDPDKAVPAWSLNEIGNRRVRELAGSEALNGTSVVISSAETKAIETAKPLADAFGCPLEVRERTHENDRSATGFLPPDEFEAVANQFFEHPTKSIRGWETAVSAQSRIVAEVEECLRIHGDGSILLVGHGGVGTLLYCYLAGVPISRKYDQGAGGGGCFFEFTDLKSRPISSWQPMEKLMG